MANPAPKGLTKYKPEYCEQVKEWRISGLTVAQMCQNLDIARPTFYSWIRIHPEFKEAYDEARKSMVMNVENELFKRAGEHYVTEYVETLNADGTKQLITKTRVISADPGLIRYILGNRSGGEWRNPDHVIEETADEIIVRIPKMKSKPETE